MLKALKLWQRFLGKGGLSVKIKSDSIVALALAEKLASASPALNFLGAELALQVELLDLATVTTGHIAGKTNVLADFLSRVHAPGGTHGTWPVELHGVKLRKWAVLPSALFRLPTPKRTDVWGDSKSRVALAAISSLKE